MRIVQNFFFYSGLALSLLSANAFAETTNTPVATPELYTAAETPATPPVAPAQPVLNTPLDWLNAMQQAQAKQNYGISFVSITPAKIESLRYYHVFSDQQTYAQLTTLDNNLQEEIQRGDVISYFAPNAMAFSLNGTHIADKFPNILWANLNEVMVNYDVIPMGFGRIANQLVRQFRIIPKDNFRNQLRLFIDVKNHLLLRRDVLDRNDNLLAQYRVVSEIPIANTEEFIQHLNALPIPPFVASQTTAVPPFHWQANWIPAGFKLIKRSVIVKQDQRIESEFYSDGLFSFTINVAPSIIQNAPEKSWTQGMTTLYTVSHGKTDLTFIGELPVSTAKRIVEEITEKPTP